MLLILLILLLILLLFMLLPLAADGIPETLVTIQFLDPIHSRQDSLDGGSARRKAAT
jgi:hypothetical protein